MPSQRLGTPNRRRDYYSRFSEAEMDRRRENARDMMREEGLDALVLYGGHGFDGTHIRYLTNYTPGFATYYVFFRDPAESDLILVGISNHVQYIREVSEVEEIDLMLHDPPGTVAERLREADVGAVGLVGFDPRYDLSIPHGHYDDLQSGIDADLVDATAPFTKLSAVKSEPELERIRRAAEVLDAGVEGFEAAIEPGVTEHDLADAFEEACKEAGGKATLDFITSAPMVDAEPGEPLTWHHPSSRTIETGDMVTMELSANYRGYQSQIHRPFTVGEPPTETYEEIYDLAEEAYDDMVAALQPGNTVADVHEALSPIEESEHKIYDVMLHGYGNGYLHPFVGTEASNYWPGADDPLTADWEFEEDMVMVVQPNVVTQDETHGLQLGTTVIVGDDPEVVHDYPVRFTQVR